MKLRGAFNPLFHIVIGAVLVVLAGWLALGIHNSEIELSSARLDFRLLPVGFLVGLGIGVPIGIWHLRGLRKALPEVDGQFYLSEVSVLARSREGQNARTLRQIGIGLAFALWFILILQTDGRLTLFGTFAFYVLGQYLTGQLLPFVRLLFELRRTTISS